MKCKATWGKQDVAQFGRTADVEIFGTLEFEADSLTAAKTKATRAMKADSKMERYVKPEYTAPPRWSGWSEPELTARVGAPPVLLTTKNSESFDLPITYGNPRNDPGDQHPGHFGWLSLVWTPQRSRKNEQENLI